MSEIKFSKEEVDILTEKIQHYFSNELDHEMGQFDAQFFLDFISKEIGAYYYNKGLYDAQSILKNRIESISEAIYEIEKSTEFSK
ncbi:MAG: DUF2164 domain-containing protein [Gammaproteobacteria bacterium]|nr:DUF2164 domain-containing protein [Gammaproteobacteria bacterium]